MLLESKVAPKVTPTDGSDMILKNYFSCFDNSSHIAYLFLLEQSSWTENGLDSYCTSRNFLNM